MIRIIALVSVLMFSGRANAQDFNPKEAEGASEAEAPDSPGQHFASVAPGVYTKPSTRMAITGRYEYLMIDGMFGFGAMVTYAPSSPSTLVMSIPIFYHMRSSIDATSDVALFFAPGTTRTSGTKPDGALLFGIEKEIQIGGLLAAPFVYGDFNKNGTPFFVGLNLGFKSSPKP